MLQSVQNLTRLLSFFPLPLSPPFAWIHFAQHPRDRPLALKTNYYYSTTMQLDTGFPRLDSPTVHRVTSISLGHSSRHLSTLRRHRIIRDTYYRRTGRLSFLSSLNNANVIPRNEFSVPLRVVEEGLTSLCLRIPAMHVRARVFTHAMCLIIDSQRVQRATLIGLDNFVTSIFE